MPTFESAKLQEGINLKTKANYVDWGLAQLIECFQVREEQSSILGLWTFFPCWILIIQTPREYSKVDTVREFFFKTIFQAVFIVS